LRKAVAKNWCLNPNCTTCGAMEFRSALREIRGDLGGPLADALAVLVDADELMSLPGWESGLEIAVRDLPLPRQATSVLECWLSRSDQNLRFFDFVLYRFVRYLPDDQPIKTRYVSKAISLANETLDFSLVESLILTLRHAALAHNDLIAIAKAFATKSAQMRRVLRNACNIEVESA